MTQDSTALGVRELSARVISRFVAFSLLSLAFGLPPAAAEPDDVSPSVAITGPASGTTYETVQTVSIVADASDDVRLRRVKFYDNGVLKGTDSNPPFTHAWRISTTSNGIHAWTARAFDAAGNYATSAAVNLTVNIQPAGADRTAPAVAITSPAPGSRLTVAQTVNIVASASDNVRVRRVKFYDNGVLKATDISAPFNYAWRVTGTSNGNHGWTAQAVDSAGNETTSAPVNVTVAIGIGDTDAPTVGITSPAAGSSFTTAQTVTIAASASDDTGVTRVEFADNGTIRATDTSAPYSYPWSVTASNNGSHSWTARAFDAAGNSAVSTAVNVAVNVPPPPPPLVVTTSDLPEGVVGSAYGANLQATGGTKPYAWSRLSGELPDGLVLSGSGAISGTPTTPGDASFGVRVQDAGGTRASASLGITIDPAPVAGSPFGHVVVIVEENRDYSAVVGNTSKMPYLNALMAKYGLATQYYGNTHPSIGDYFMLTTGQILTNDDSKKPSTFPVSVDNVVRQLLAHGKTWKSYAEDLPYAGYTGGNTALYAVRHNPLAYFTDVKDDAVQKLNLVPFTEFATDLAAGDLPNYSFIVPNLCSDGHDCGLDVVDNWLETHIAPLLTNPAFKEDGLLIITFDEASGSDDTHGGGRIATVVISPKFSKAGYKSTTFYQHQSALRLTLEGLGIKALPGASATAPAMWEFFTFPPP